MLYFGPTQWSLVLPTSTPVLFRQHGNTEKNLNICMYFEIIYVMQEMVPCGTKWKSAILSVFIYSLGLYSGTKKCKWILEEWATKSCLAYTF